MIIGRQQSRQFNGPRSLIHMALLEEEEEEEDG